MSNYGRYFSPRDFNLVHSFNSELFNDLIQSICTLYKLSGEETTTNVYGEASSEKGKVYYPGKQLECLVEFSPSTTNYDEFGPDKKKLANFRFVERFMQQSNLYPETGDIVFWDNQFFEVSNNIQEQYIGGQEGKQLSIICETFLVRLSGLNIVENELPIDEESIESAVNDDDTEVTNGGSPNFEQVSTGSSTPPTPPASTEPIGDSLEALWPFNVNVNPLAEYLDVNNYNLLSIGSIDFDSNYGSLGFPTNVSHYAQLFGSEYLETRFTSIVGDGGLTPRSYSGWFLSAAGDVGHEAIYSEGISSISSTGNSLTITLNNGRICLVTEIFHTDSASSLDQSAYYGTPEEFTVPSPLVWSFFTVVLNINGYIDEAIVYVNGVQKTLDVTESSDHVVADVATGNATFLGARNLDGTPDFHWTGQFSQLMKFNSVISLEQHQWMYNGGLGRTPAEIESSVV